MEMGVWIHDFIRRNEWELDVIMGTSLIDKYLKCGRIDEGLKAFRSMKEKNFSTWNALIQGLGFVKSEREAVCRFNRMEQEWFEADHVTLATVLNACSHSGLVDMGRQIFSSLINGNYGFSPSVNALRMFDRTLGMRWPYGNLELSDIADKKLAELESDNVLIMLLLSTLHAEVGRHGDGAGGEVMTNEREWTYGVG
ncbi:hypothetical protein Peur_048559 [Populus x canadensis]